MTASSELRTSNDHEVARERYTACGATPGCLGRLNLHVDIAYQPADRYRAFPWLEAAVYLALAVLLALTTGFRVTRVTG